LAALVVQVPVDAREDVVGSELGDVAVGGADGLVVVGDEPDGVVKTELGAVVVGFVVW